MPNQDQVVLVVQIGILALQGAFIEHEEVLSRPRFDSISVKPKTTVTIRTLQVRTKSDLDRCDALIIPGGESTTIALLARINGLLEPLRDFAKHKPIWGTCAGAILLASGGVEGAKTGGQEVIGGVDIRIKRNGWGAQQESFEADLAVDGIRDSDRPFTGLFIRAPIIVGLLDQANVDSESASRPKIEVLARLSTQQISERHVEWADNQTTDETNPSRIVALRQGRHLLTTFHPELTKDDRFHEYFVEECVLKEL